MARAGWIGAVAALAAVAGWVPFAAAGELLTKIDLDYTYAQENLGGDVTADTTFAQKYEATYLSTGGAYEYVLSGRLELLDTWHSREADDSRISPTLELGVRGARSALKVSYESAVSSTEAYQESAEVTSFQNNFNATFQALPTVWPEVRLKLQQRRSYQEQASDRTHRSLEFTALKDLDLMRLEYNILREWRESVLGEDTREDSTEWTLKASLRETLWAGTELDLAYEITESYLEGFAGGIFQTSDEKYTQELRSKIRKPLTLSPRLTGALLWDYQYLEDLLELDFDYSFKNQYGLVLRMDLLDWARVAGDFKRSTEHLHSADGRDDSERVTDTVKLVMDMEPVTWLRLAGGAEFQWDDSAAESTGGSVDRTRSERYELVARNVFGEVWELNLNAATKYERSEGQLTSQEAKLKADLRLRFGDLILGSAFESTRLSEWDVGREDPASQELVKEGKFRMEYRRQFFDVIRLSFSHSYSRKEEERLDAALSFDRTRTLNEDTRLNLALVELFPDARLEGEISRKASDTEDDPDPMLVEVTYQLKLDWRKDDLNLLAGMQYNDKGDTFDDLILNGKIEWRGDQVEFSGEYKFEKTYADVTDENRTLNLKFVYHF